MRKKTYLASLFEYPFKIKDERFLNRYKEKEANFGFNGLGYTVYKKSYARKKEDGEDEEWYDTIKRVVEGTFTIRKSYIKNKNKQWIEEKAQEDAKFMFKTMFKMRFLPPGRGLWAMGTDIIKKNGGTALNNCAFRSTKNIDREYAYPFTFIMDALMQGVGVGSDVKGSERVTINTFAKKDRQTYVIPDSREGWVESVERLLNSYLDNNNRYEWEFDYSKIRQAGEPLKTFGGVSSGPEPLMELHENIKTILDKRLGNKLTITDIADILNAIGKCVIAGNIRRSAELILGPETDEFYDLKDYNKNPHRESFAWTSNNSVIGKTGMDYTKIVNKLDNGEPGIFWLDNARKFSRMCDVEDNKDMMASGVNPCAEQTLEDGELCCLGEIFLNKYDNTDEDKCLEKFTNTIKVALTYTKTVTLVPTGWEKTDKIIKKNRRLGCSLSGITQFLEKNSLHNLKRYLERGYLKLKYYDKCYSDWFDINESIKITSIKPSGTVSLLAGASPGVHFPESRFYIRRVRFSKNSALLSSLKKHGYYFIETDPCDKNSSIVEFPVDSINDSVDGKEIKTIKTVSMWEQLELTAFIQQFWADNQVSVTIKYKENEKADIKSALEYFQYRLKSVTFLPYKTDYYEFPPYEEISEGEYKLRKRLIIPLRINRISDSDKVEEEGCDGGFCMLNK